MYGADVRFSAACGPSDAGVHQYQPQGVQDPLGLGTDKSASVVDVKFSDTPMGCQNVADARLEGKGALAEGEGCVEYTRVASSRKLISTA